MSCKPLGPISGQAHDISAPYVATPREFQESNRAFQARMQDPEFARRHFLKSECGKYNSLTSKTAKKRKVSMPTFSWDQEPRP